MKSDPDYQSLEKEGLSTEKSRVKRALAEIKEAERSFEGLMKMKEELRSSYESIVNSKENRTL